MKTLARLILFVTLLGAVFFILGVAEAYSHMRVCDKFHTFNWLLCLLRADGNLTGGVLGSAGAIFAAWLAWQSLQPQLAISKFQSAAQVFQGLNDLVTAIQHERYMCIRLRYSTFGLQAAERYFREYDKSPNNLFVEAVNKKLEKHDDAIEMEMWDFLKSRSKTWDNPDISEVRKIVFNTYWLARQSTTQHKSLLVDLESFWLQTGAKDDQKWQAEIKNARDKVSSRATTNFVEALTNLIEKLDEEESKLMPLFEKSWKHLLSFS